MAEQQESIFRKQSIESISSPEQLNDYIKSSTPSVWFILIAVVFLLIGVCAWGIYGRLDTRIESGAVASGGKLTVFIPEEYDDMIKSGMPVTVNDRDYTINEISYTIVQLTDEYDPYALHKAGLTVGDFGVTAIADTDLPDGSYKVTVTVESIPPMSFILN